MPSPYFINPLSNPIFLPLLIQITSLFLVGFIFIFVLNKLHLRNIFQTKFGSIYLGWLILAPIYLAGIFLGRMAGLLFLFIMLYLAIREISYAAKIPRVYTYTLIGLSFISILIASFTPQ